jgi:hypothetical protein
MDNCPICGRPFDTTMSEHHLIPKSKKGKDTVTVHNVCHSKIHSVFVESELKNYYHTIARIMESDQMQKFAKWAAKKPANFQDSSNMTNQRHPRKRK